MSTTLIERVHYLTFIKEPGLTNAARGRHRIETHHGCVVFKPECNDVMLPIYEYQKELISQTIDLRDELIKIKGQHSKNLILLKRIASSPWYVRLLWVFTGVKL